MPVQKKVAITGAILLVTGTLVVWTVVRGLFAGDPFSSTTRIDPPPTSLPTRPDPPRPAGALAQLEAELREGGWQREERMAFVAISGDWFEILHAEARPYFEDQMKALARLGGHRKALKLVRSNPEFAGLLALADHPNDLAEILDSADANARQTLIGLFARCADRHDLNDLVAALADNRDVVVKLLDRGLVGVEVLFVFDRGTPGAKDYERWLRETVEGKLLADDSDLASFVQFVLLQGDDLRDRMDKVAAFHRAFPNEIWPKLVRTIETGMPLEYYVSDSNVWKLLALSRGEELLQRRGLQAVELLFGKNAYAAEHHDKVSDILLNGDRETYNSLTAGLFRRDERFLRLLNRPLSGAILAKALSNLVAAGVNYREKLERYDRLDDKALTADVGPPPEGVKTFIPFYAAYEVGEKILDGRGVTGVEAAKAGAFTVLDVTSVVFPLAKAGQFLKASTKTVGKELAKDAAHAEVRDLAKKAAIRNVTQSGAELLVARKMDEQVVRWAVTGALTTMLKNFRVFRKLSGHSATIDVTAPLKFFCNHTRYGAKSLERFAKLDAKVLMTGEGRVHLQIENLACELAQQYLNGVRKKIAIEMRPAAIGGEQPTGRPLSSYVTAAEQNKHLSAWWLSNLGGGMPAR